MERGRIAFYVFLAACSVLLLQSCAKKDNEKDPNAPCDKVRLTEYECKGDCGNPLCGRWRWVETSAPLPEPHNLQTPESTGDCELYLFHHDGWWVHAKNGQEDGQGNYSYGHGVYLGWNGYKSLIGKEYDSVSLRISTEKEFTYYYAFLGGRLELSAPIGRIGEGARYFVK